MIELPEYTTTDSWGLLNDSEWEVIRCLVSLTPEYFASISMGLREGIIGLSDGTYICLKRRAAVLKNNADNGKFDTPIINEFGHREYLIQKYIKFAQEAVWEMPDQLIMISTQDKKNNIHYIDSADPYMSDHLYYLNVSST